MRSGDIYRANLDPTVGDEIRKIRPVVVLNPGDRKSLRLSIVVPVTHWRPKWDRSPFFFTADPQPHHGLGSKLAVDCFQIRTLSHDRFLERIGSLTDRELARIKAALALILDIEAPHCL